MHANSIKHQLLFTIPHTSLHSYSFPQHKKNIWLAWMKSRMKVKTFSKTTCFAWRQIAQELIFSEICLVYIYLGWRNKSVIHACMGKRPWEVWFMECFNFNPIHSDTRQSVGDGLQTRSGWFREMSPWVASTVLIRSVVVVMISVETKWK